MSDYVHGLVIIDLALNFPESRAVQTTHERDSSTLIVHILNVTFVEIIAAS
jgi:hypothetical protein